MEPLLSMPVTSAVGSYQAEAGASICGWARGTKWAVCDRGPIFSMKGPWRCGGGAPEEAAGSAGRIGLALQADYGVELQELWRECSYSIRHRNWK